jgi:hypothetical protein
MAVHFVVTVYEGDKDILTIPFMVALHSFQFMVCCDAKLDTSLLEFILALGFLVVLFLLLGLGIGSLMFGLFLVR